MFPSEFADTWTMKGQRSLCRQFCWFDSRFAALTAAYLTFVMSVLSLAVYVWKSLADFQHDFGINNDHFRGTFYGLEISQFILITVHFLILPLTTILLLGIYREKLDLLLSWLVGFVTLVSLELMCLMSSVVLLMHVHKSVDALLQLQVSFCLTRLIVNVLAITSVVAFYRQLTYGRSWKPLSNVL